MDNAVTIVVMGEPVAKARPRASSFGGFVRIYTPKKSAKYEQAVRSAALRVLDPQRSLDGPIAVRIEFVTEVPASWPKYKRAAAFAQQLYPTGKPDLDNLTKSILDALNGVAFKDDAQITDLTLTKRYGLGPCAIIRLAPIVLQDAGREAA